MSALTASFIQFFTAFSTLFRAFNNVATAMENITDVAAEASGTYRDQARIERAAKLRALNAEHQLSITQ